MSRTTAGAWPVSSSPTFLWRLPGADPMDFSTSIALAWRALRRNGLRSALTLLGIVIGVGAVLTMVAVGNGARGSIEDQFAAAGLNVITVTAGNYKMKGEDPGGGVVDHTAVLGQDGQDGRDRQGGWGPALARLRKGQTGQNGFGLGSAVYHPGTGAVFRLVGHPEDDPMEKHDHPTAR